VHPDSVRPAGDRGQLAAGPDGIGLVDPAGGLEGGGSGFEEGTAGRCVAGSEQCGPEPDTGLRDWHCVLRKRSIAGFECAAEHGQGLGGEALFDERGPDCDLGFRDACVARREMLIEDGEGLAAAGRWRAGDTILILFLPDFRTNDSVIISTD
jgi:hypothetical protein